jgi:hypothetical protein
MRGLQLVRRQREAVGADHPVAALAGGGRVAARDVAMEVVLVHAAAVLGPVTDVATNYEYYRIVDSKCNET